MLVLVVGGAGVGVESLAEWGSARGWAGRCLATLAGGEGGPGTGIHLTARAGGSARRGRGIGVLAPPGARGGARWSAAAGGVASACIWGGWGGRGAQGGMGVSPPRRAGWRSGSARIGGVGGVVFLGRARGGLEMGRLVRG